MDKKTRGQVDQIDNLDDKTGLCLTFSLLDGSAGPRSALMLHTNTSLTSFRLTDSRSISKMMEDKTAGGSRGLRRAETEEIEETEGQRSTQHNQAGTTLASKEVTSTMSGVAGVTLIASTPRIFYNSGYGDFCFGRLIQSKRPLSQGWNAPGSHGAAVPELDNFVRYLPFVGCSGSVIIFAREGTFPFFDLPLEIRHRIFRLLLGPFYCDGTLRCSNMPKRHIEIRVRHDYY